MLNLLRALRQRVMPDERGSLALTMSVLMIVANLSTLVLVRTLATLKAVRSGQDFAASLADADGAMADALFQIDQATPSTISGAGTVAGRGSYKYLATKVDADTYDVVAKGILNGSNHAIHATVARAEKYPYAVFSQQALTFNGSGAGNVYSFDSSTAIHTGKARVGSNNAISVKSGNGAGDFQDYFAPNGSCSGCANGVLKAGPYLIPDPQLPTAPTVTQACPVGGIFTGTVNGGSGTPYVCDQDVTLSGTINVSSPDVIIYITASHSLSMSGANVNPNGLATNFQIYKIGTGAINNGSGANAATFRGILYAPKSLLTINGGETFYGSVTVNQLTVNGNPNFTLAYDGAVSSILAQNWHVTHWREVPSTSVNL